MATILIVDDDAETRELLGRCVGIMDGHRAVLAADGAAGLDVVAAERVDLIVLDMMMPGMDGAEFLDRLRATPAGRSVSVYICSAIGNRRLSPYAKLPGVTGVLDKGEGFFIDLVEAVTRHVRQVTDVSAN